jgi:transposase
MPPIVSILGIEGFEVEDIHGINPIVFKVRYLLAKSCVHCQGESLRLKDTFYRWVRHESLGTRHTRLYLRTHKYLCRQCGRYFNDRFPGILPYRRTTQAFRREVFQRHYDGVCGKTLSERLLIGEASVERFYRDMLTLKLSELKNNPCPRVLGIDEHFFTRKDGYATTLCDLGKRRVYDVIPGRSEIALEGPLGDLLERDKVKVIVMDLSETYRSICRKHFKNAKIVADRFHVIRLVNHHFLKTWQILDPEGRKNRGLISLMRRHEANLGYGQKQRLFAYLDSVPGLRIIWEFKQRLCQLLLVRRRTKRECKKLIPFYLGYVGQLKESAFEPLKTLGKTLDSWSEEIVRMWRFTKSNGITEGFHNKMELIKRRAYGFRNFENYRLRVRALCA